VRRIKGCLAAAQHVAANREGYAQLEAWAASLAGNGRVLAYGVEGTGSYGVGLASFLRRTGHRVIEVNRGDRRSRRSNGKSDTLDSEAPARAVLGGQAKAVPKSADGTAEMIRQIKIARDTARKARTSAIITLKALIVTAPADLREHLAGTSDKVLIDRCASLRPGAVTSPTASAKLALRTLAKRYQALAAEIREHDTILDDLTRSHAPTLREGLASARTPQLKWLSSLATTLIESTPKLPSPSSAAPVRSRPRRACRTGTGFHELAIAMPTRPSTGP